MSVWRPPPMTVERRRGVLRRHDLIRCTRSHRKRERFRRLYRPLAHEVPLPAPRDRAVDVEVILAHPVAHDIRRAIGCLRPRGSFTITCTVLGFLGSPVR